MWSGGVQSTQRFYKTHILTKRPKFRKWVELSESMEQRFESLLSAKKILSKTWDPDGKPIQEALSTNQKQYVHDLFMMDTNHKGAEAITLCMNSEDASSIGHAMSEGNVVLFDKEGNVRPSAFPDNMFSCIMATPIQERDITKKDMRRRLSAYLQSKQRIGSDDGMDVKAVIFGDGGGNGTPGRDRSKWTAEMGPGSWTGVRFKKLDRGQYEFWLVTHCKSPSISAYFHALVKMLASKDKNGLVNVKSLAATAVFAKLQDLAKRNCARVMRETAKALGVTIPARTDMMAHRADEREGYQKMANPRITNVYNTLVRITRNNKKMTLMLNKTTSLESSNGLLLLTHPLKPVALYQVDGTATKIGGKRITDSRIFKTAPVCMGREVSKSSVQPATMSAKNRAYAEKCYFWEGKDIGTPLPHALQDDSFRELTKTRRNCMNNIYCVPGKADDLHPCALFIKV